MIPSSKNMTFTKRQDLTAEQNTPNDEKIWKTNYRLRVAHKTLVFMLTHGDTPSSCRTMLTTQVVKGKYDDSCLDPFRKKEIERC